MSLVTEDTSRVPVPHVSGWGTYDVSFKLTGRRGVRSMTFFAANDLAAHAQADMVTDQCADELTASRGVVLAYDMKVTRRVPAPDRPKVTTEDREAAGLARLHRGMNGGAL